MKKNKASRSSNAPKSPQGTALEMLSRSFDALRTSPHLEMLKGLNVRGLLGDRAVSGSGLDDFTLGELLTLGPLEVAKLPGMNALRNVKTLAERIRTISEVQPGTHFDAPGLMPPLEPSALGLELATPNSLNEVAGPAAHRSTEAELALLRSLEELRGLARSDLPLQKKLADYWSPSLARAPFEEQLSVQQLLEIDIEALLKKRSFTAPKLFALTKVINNIVEASSSVHRAGEVMPSVRPVSRAQISFAETAGSTTQLPQASHSLDLSGPALSPHDIAALWGLEAFILSHPEGSYLRRVFSPLADVATSGNLLKVLTGDDLIVSTIEENDLDNLKRRFTRLAPEIFAVWESSLVGPGASLSRFRSTLMSHPVPTGSLTNDTVLRMERPEGFLEAALTRLLLRALNAVPVTFRGRQIPNYWTSNPTLFPIVFESLLANFPSSPPAQEHLLLRSLPLFPPQFLREFAKLSLSASGSMD